MFGRSAAAAARRVAAAGVGGGMALRRATTASGSRKMLVGAGDARKRPLDYKSLGVAGGIILALVSFKFWRMVETHEYLVERRDKGQAEIREAMAPVQVDWKVVEARVASLERLLEQRPGSFVHPAAVPVGATMEKAAGDSDCHAAAE